MLFSKAHRRNFEASLHVRFGGAALRKRVSAALAHLRPYTTDKPLIRIGGIHDGAYLLPDDLEGVSSFFSPGVSEAVDFDLALVARGLRGYLADASVSRPANLNEDVVFDPLYLGASTGGNTISLKDWICRYVAKDTDLLLQMDIEGSEYETLAAAPDEILKRFRIVVIEFHKLHHIFRSNTLELYETVFSRLAERFSVVHIHPNNVQPVVKAQGFSIPPIVEVTFLRRDRIREMNETEVFPHPLDQPNSLDHPDFPMPPFWKPIGEQ